MKYVIHCKKTGGFFKRYFGCRWKNDYPIDQAQLFESVTLAMDYVREYTAIWVSRKTLRACSPWKGECVPDYLNYDVREVVFSPAGDMTTGKVVSPDPKESLRARLGIP